MNYARIKYFDIANAPGVGVSLFVSGCPLHCEGCFNSEAQDYNFGEPYTNKTTSTSYYVTVSIKENSVLNVRSSPGTTGKIVKMLKNKERVLIVGEKTIGFTKWGKIKNGGWICLTYTKRG